MFPNNMDPKALKGMLDRLGIKSSEIEGKRVVIECADKDIIIEEPQITLTEGQGMKSFTVMGRITEVDKTAVEISEDDVKLVKEQSGISDDDLVRKALEEAKGNIAEAIIRLKKGQ